MEKEKPQSEDQGQKRKADFTLQCLYPWVFARAAGDLEWFRAHPTRRYRLRKRVPQETAAPKNWPCTHVLVVRTSFHDHDDLTCFGVGSSYGETKGLCDRLMATLGEHEEAFLAALHRRVKYYRHDNEYVQAVRSLLDVADGFDPKELP
jgi:hypothetical protein